MKVLKKLIKFNKVIELSSSVGLRGLRGTVLTDVEIMALGHATVLNVS